MNDFIEKWQNNEKYIQMLTLMGRLSNLFAETEIPFIHYRVTENLFCKYCNADNLSRTDTAYDAKIENLGIGIKTFQIKNDQSTEKIAEFNSLSRELKQYSGIELAKKLAVYRNKRMQVANDLYDITDSIYHIIGRMNRSVCIFDTPYEFINENQITKVFDNNKSLKFSDGINEYTFNYSKSVLLKKFIVPAKNKIIPIEIINDPYAILEQLISGIHESQSVTEKILGIDFVILPLFSLRDNNVQSSAGLNQWNAKGRKRHMNEVYIPVPNKINNIYPNFFPPRDQDFNLSLPDGKTVLKAKMCQVGRKGLMSNPNKDLGNWILRKVLKLEPYELLTLEKLNEAGFDSVIVNKVAPLEYTIDVRRGTKFIEEE
ncbi:MAG: NgoFVII family restriction endonuclease [Muribaculaceae bacterium]